MLGARPHGLGAAPVFVLTGAGLSAESGLGTFRGAPDALWAKHNPYDLATPEAFARDPALVHSFYDARRRALLDAMPNAAHRALKRLQDGTPTVLCTQNVDDLLERAGTADVIHMHGMLTQARCLRCSAVLEWREDLGGAFCPACGGAGCLRPDVMWFGEEPMHLDRIMDALAQARLFVAIGTSGSVYPAAGFVAEARRRHIQTLEINLHPSDTARQFDAAQYGPATEAVPAWVDAVLGA